MTTADVLAVVDRHIDRARDDSQRRFLSLVLADAPDLDVDALDVLLEQNTADFEHARARAHHLIHSTRKD